MYLRFYSASTEHAWRRTSATWHSPLSLSRSLMSQAALRTPSSALTPIKQYGQVGANLRFYSSAGHSWRKASASWHYPRATWHSPLRRAMTTSHTTVRTPITPMEQYDQLVAQGDIHNDPKQRETVMLLENLHKQLQTYQPKAMTRSNKTEPSLFSAFLSKARSLGGQGDATSSPSEKEPSHSPKGLYLHGDVGSGKTMLMDLFYDSVQSKGKKRVHFHSFMLDVHRRIHKWRHTPGRNRKTDFDPIPAVVESMLSENWLICFDEFQVTDVADAAILHRLFRGLYEGGAVVVSTSNRKPDNLYERGLQRDLFLPFISLTYARNIVHELSGGVDYRLVGETSEQQVYFVCENPEETPQEVDELFTRLSHNEQVSSAVLPLSDGRSFTVPKQARGVAFFTFDQLCRQPVGPADFIALAQEYHTMNSEKQNEIRRFINLIDETYQHRVKLICVAQAAPTGLFVNNQGEQLLEDPGAPQPMVPESEGFKDFDLTREYDLRNLFSGREEAFMFGRAASRLAEMQTRNYLKLVHRKQVKN